MFNVCGYRWLDGRFWPTWVCVQEKFIPTNVYMWLYKVVFYHKYEYKITILDGNLSIVISTQRPHLPPFPLFSCGKQPQQPCGMLTGQWACSLVASVWTGPSNYVHTFFRALRTSFSSICMEFLPCFFAYIVLLTPFVSSIHTRVYMSVPICCLGPGPQDRD